MSTPALAGLVLLVVATPVALWVMWSDMARMKIPNMAVLALAGLFLVTGPFVLPLAEYGWRWTHLLIVLAAGFIANMAGLVGAGDAKFAAAMAPFFAAGDWMIALVLFSGVLIAAFAAHRTVRAVPVLRAAAPHWESWHRKDFPMGLALGGTLMLYLGLCAFG